MKPNALMDIPPAQAMKVMRAAKTHCLQQFGPSLTGIAIRKQKSYYLDLQFRSGQIPAAAPVSELNFRGFTIPVTISEGSEARLTMGIGGSFSAAQQQETGVAGIKVQGTKKANAGWYLLANYHVAAAEAMQADQFKFPYPDCPQIDCVMPAWAEGAGPGNKIGSLYQGLFSIYHDIALISLDDPDSVDNTTPDGNQITQSLDIFNDQTQLGQTVTMYAHLSGTRQGTIISLDAGAEFNFNGISYQKDNLIQIDHISQEGDSGSPVVLNGALIGLILGDDNTSSYVLPIQRIFNKFNLSL